jgi:hypothetical protein
MGTPRRAQFLLISLLQKAGESAYPLGASVNHLRVASGLLPDLARVLTGLQLNTGGRRANS